jgi:hypothetical protein
MSVVGGVIILRVPGCNLLRLFQKRVLQSNLTGVCLEPLRASWGIAFPVKLSAAVFCFFLPGDKFFFGAGAGIPVRSLYKLRCRGVFLNDRANARL